MKISYNWLQNYFEEKLPTPEKISEGIIFHSFEVESLDRCTSPTGTNKEDWIFDIKVLPDRAHDCLSHWGIAKEISAIFDMKIKKDNSWGQGRSLKEPSQGPSLRTQLKIQIQDHKCIRYMGRIVKNIKVGPSPNWLKEKLNAIGQKSINNIVDMANFVMFDLGQPIHCFDLDKLESEKIIIRNAKVGEKITTLDKREVNLDESILVIADEKDPLAIAGIKGGTKAEVDNNTKNIVIEVANFNSTTTRKTAKKINIQTEAVKRYENGISPELCYIAMEAVTDMIYNLAGGEVENLVDIYPKKIEQKNIQISTKYINKRLGSDFSNEKIENVWKKLNFVYTGKDGEYKIEVPYLRLDLIGPHDLTEEVIRILGYDKLEGKLPEVELQGRSLKELSQGPSLYYKMLLTRDKLLNDGYSEVMTYTFRDKGDVEVLASASDKKFLRNNLTDGLKESIKLNILNLPLLDMDDVKVFEIGTVFKKMGEEMHVAYGDKKEIKEMKLEEFVEEKLSPEVHGYFSAEKFLVLGSTASQVTSEETSLPLTNSRPFKMWSMYPFITRDIAVWVPNKVESYQVYKVIKENAGELLVKDPYLFDSFNKDDKTSFAYRLVFQSYDRTLTDEEINVIMSKITEKIVSLGWEVR